MHEKYPNVFSPHRIGNVVLKSHLICPPNAPTMLQGQQNYPTDALINHYAARARGGAAIVTFSGGYLKPPDETMHRWGWDVTNPLTQHHMSMAAEAIHSYNSLCNAFLITFPDPGYEVSQFDRVLNKEVLKFCPPGAVEMPTEMVHEHIERYVKQIKAQAECGFDGVNIHMCYRYSFAARFLSPMTNLRTDEFRGDTFEGRTRFARLLTDGIKKACGKDFLIEVTISGHDPVENGWTIDDTVRFSKDMAGLVDIMTIRSPLVDPQHPIGFELNPRPWVDLAAQVKANSPLVNIAASSGLFDPEANEQILAEGKADLLSMARAFVSNPDYGIKVYQGREKDLVPCIRCNKCLRSAPHDPYLSVCAVNPARGMEHLYANIQPMTPEKKQVAVIGGGPAGMAFAMYAAERGHSVDLYEKSDRLGGLLKHCDHVPFKWPLRDYKDFLIRKMQETPGIALHMNSEPTVEQLNASGADVVVSAVGSEPLCPPIPGADGEQVFFGAEIFGKEDRLDHKVVVIGGGEVGIECGIHLARLGHEVVLLEQKEKLAEEADHSHYYSLLMGAMNGEAALNPITKARVTEILPGEVVYQDEAGTAHRVSCGSVVLSAGMRAKTDEAMKYAGAGTLFRIIGDCRKAATVQQAVRQAYTLALSL